jgi:hypothetical protein
LNLGDSVGCSLLGRGSHVNKGDPEPDVRVGQPAVLELEERARSPRVLASQGRLGPLELGRGRSGFAHEARKPSFDCLIEEEAHQEVLAYVQL